MKQLVSVCLFLLAACTTSPPSDTQVLAIGDSILTWNQGTDQDIPSLVARKTGLRVFNAARAGAEFFEDRTIPDQYQPGSWDWVILDGGGNDLGKACFRTDAAAAILDRLIAPDLSGAYRDLVDRIAVDGAQVVIMGYAPVSLRGGPFEGCATVLAALSDRQAALADATDGVEFVDARDVIAPDNFAAYTIDRVHPTPLAGDLISDLIADVLLSVRQTMV